MSNETEEQPNAEKTKPKYFYTEQQSLSTLTGLCVAVAAGERVEDLAGAYDKLRAGGSTGLAYLQAIDVTSREFAIKMGCLLRLVALEYLDMVGCPESALKTNLKFLIDTMATEHQRLVTDEKFSL